MGLQILRKKCCELYNLLRRQNVATSIQRGRKLPPSKVCARNGAVAWMSHFDIRSSIDGQRVTAVGEAAHPQVLRSSEKSVKNTLFSASEQKLRNNVECGRLFFFFHLDS